MSASGRSWPGPGPTPSQPGGPTRIMGRPPAAAGTHARVPEARMNSILDRVKYVSVAVFSSAIVLFALTNLNTVEVRVIAWRFEAGVSLLILVPFLAGLLIGLWTGLLRRHGKAKKAKAQDEETATSSTFCSICFSALWRRHMPSSLKNR